MPSRARHHLKHPFRYFLFALLLLCLVYGVPHDGHRDGQSFLAVAQSAAWTNLAEWSAAWCSLKIILFCFGTFFLAVAVEEMVITTRYEKLAKLFLILAFLPILASLLGVYLLIKAVL